MPHRATPLAERFWSKVAITEPDECWMFIGSIRPNGYGQVFIEVGQPPLKAHRAAFLLAYGYLTPGLDVAHTCDVRYPAGDISYRKCCNPLHLTEQTRQENLNHARALGRLDQVANTAVLAKIDKSAAGTLGAFMRWVVSR